VDGDDERWVTVTKRQSVKPGEVMGVTVGDLEIALYNVDGSLYATDNICTHAYAQLDQGYLDGDVIECPMHGGQFDVKTGKGLCHPIAEDLRVYQVRVLGEDVQVYIVPTS
jgi:nitrite reductase/ring-hydroxylating ferredoxin subunit